MGEKKEEKGIYNIPTNHWSSPKEGEGGPEESQVCMLQEMLVSSSSSSSSIVVVVVVVECRYYVGWPTDLFNILFSISLQEE
jgi:hypothetical protein